MQVADIIPEQPSSKPFNNFNSEPGNTEKFSIFKFSYKLYELSLTPTIWFGNFKELFLLQEFFPLFLNKNLWLLHLHICNKLVA